MGRKIYLSCIALILTISNVFAQSGEIRGKVKEKDGTEGVPFASVVAFQGGQQVQATVTDIDGNYAIKPLTPGKYDVKVTCVGYSGADVTGILVTLDRIAFVNVDLPKGIQLKEAEAVEYVIPLLDKGKTDNSKTTTREDIQAAPLRDVISVATSQNSEVGQTDERSSNLNMAGSRSDATTYYVDGVKQRGVPNVTQKGASQITTITGGLSAQYGDVTGGVISITTLGPASKISGGIEGQTSQFFDEYKNSRLSVNLSGPIISRKDGEGHKSALLGFVVSGDWTYDKDPSPSSIGAWKLKDDIQKSVEQTPLITNSVGGYDKRASYFTYDSMDHVKARQNVASRGYAFLGKLDFKPLNTLRITVGGNYSYSNGRDYVGIYSLMNTYNNTQSISDRMFGYVKVQQWFSNPTEQSKSASVVKNAYYTLQADYSRNTSTNQNPIHEDHIFRYGHVGTFTTVKTLGLYAKGFANIDANGDTLFATNEPTYRKDESDSLYLFEPSTYNPYTAAYDVQYYHDHPTPQSSSALEASGGLLNQSNRNSLTVFGGVNGITGRVSDGAYGKSESNQSRITAQGSADIKNHNIVVGVEYEQRVDRSYSVATTNLWFLMRSLANSRINTGDYDYNNADVTRDGNGNITSYTFYKPYVPTKNRDGEVVPGFYENVRNHFGVPYNRFIDIDHNAPDSYDINMFSTDELLLNGYVGYYGYDALGNKTDGNPSLQTFLTDKDKNLNFTRQIGAFRPTYTAGYIEDKFTFNEIIFRLGLRVDYFDANQLVQKDPYLLYPSYTAGNVKSDEALLSKLYPNHNQPDGQTLPSNIGSDYVVYVNSSQNPSKVTGFRHGDDWYDSEGQFTTDVQSIANKSGGTIQPYVQDQYKSTDRDNKITPDAFKDYEPQTTYMPRVAFSFPISDEAYFSANYDILTQRPDAGGIMRFSPMTYYNLANGGSGTINNPALKPQKTTTYEITFQQKVSAKSSLSIGAFYKELRDMIQFFNMQFAYPTAYSTYGNLDFGNVKGLTLTYDLRRSGNIRMNASYTLQFANGTGSSSGSNASYLSALGQTNLREVTSLDFDRRHNVVASFDYHYTHGTGYDGPVWGNSQILSNAGLNLTFRAASGTPYTRTSTYLRIGTSNNASANALVGQVNGSRLPWTFRIDAKFDKGFALTKKVSATAYLQILNVLDIQNVIAVYNSTGSPSDDGYLASAQGQLEINNLIASQRQAFQDLYQIAANQYTDYSIPRRIRLGLEINF